MEAHGTRVARAVLAATRSVTAVPPSDIADVEVRRPGSKVLQGCRAARRRPGRTHLPCGAHGGGEVRADGPPCRRADRATGGADGAGRPPNRARGTWRCGPPRRTSRSERRSRHGRAHRCGAAPCDGCARWRWRLRCPRSAACCWRSSARRRGWRSWASSGSSRWACCSASPRASTSTRNASRTACLLAGDRRGRCGDGAVGRRGARRRRARCGARVRADRGRAAHPRRRHG